MNRPHGNRARLGGMLLAAAAALAILALPGLAASHPKHKPPGDAGVIQSFDPETGVLVIDLADGGSVSGLVTRRTHVRCGPPPRRGPKGHGPSLRQRGPESDRHGQGPQGEGPESGEGPRGHDGTPPGSSEGPGQGAEKRADRCNVDDLVAGATVKVAELVLIDGNAYYKLVGLPRQAPAPA